MARNNDNECSEVYFQQGSCRITLKQGDLMNESDVDVRVIPAPERGQQTAQTYPLFDALLSKASKNLKEEIRARSSYITPGGRPEFISTAKPAIILTATPYCQKEKKALQMLNDTYLACLKLAIDQQCETIAFPTIGCGQSGFQTEPAANNLYKALVQFQQTRNKQFKEIRIIVFKSDIYDEFTSVFMKLGEDKNSKIKFVDISPKKSSIARMSSKENEKSDSQRHFHGDDTQHHSNDREEDTTEDRHGHGGKPKASLNPNSQEFQPKSKIQRRDLRQFRINNDKTELHILQGDILVTKVDAIVNAANESMLGGSGVDGIIHKAAGRKLYEACEAHKEIFRDVRLPTGRSRILLSYNMSKTTYYIINTAGPRYDDHSPKKCKEYLTSCYKTSLELANLYDLKTIGFTAISCGIFGYPIDEGAEVALSAVDQNAGSMEKIVFVLKDDEIYDAWVKKAEQLQARSQNDTGSGGASSSKQSTTYTQKPIGKPDSDDEPDAARRSARMKVNDESTADITQKPVESDRQKPPEKPPSDPDRTSDAQEATEGAEDDSKDEKDEKKKAVSSESKEKPSNNPSKPSSKKNKTSESQPAQQDSKKQGSVVRSNNKNK